MPLGILGNKIGMTQIIDESNQIIPITLLRVGPCTITQVKTKDTDGYQAVQLGYNQVSSNVLNKSKIGHLRKVGLLLLRYLHEYKIEKVDTFLLGQIISVSIFTPGSLVNVSGRSIGKGFTGLQKRHNFSRGPMTHGSKNHRAPGSIGAGTTPGRVIPGKKMAGQLGAKKITIKNLKVLNVDISNNLLVVKGTVPGKPGNLISIQLHK